jgi:ATP-dependent Lon protease
MVVDEIDKAGGEHAYDPLGALYSLLEHDTAEAFTDEFAEVAIDASQVIWVATANDAHNIPDPILNRMNVYEVQAPDRDAARHIAAKLYRSIRADHDWGSRFETEPRADVLDRMGEMAPREMRRTWMTAFGNAKLARRDHIQPLDLPEPGPPQVDDRLRAVAAVAAGVAVGEDAQAVQVEHGQPARLVTYQPAGLQRDAGRRAAR